MWDCGFQLQFQPPGYGQIMRGIAIGEEVERRKKPRIYIPFLIRVRGVDAEGKAFTVDTVGNDISTGGLYLQLPFRVNRGEKLFAVIRLSTSRDEDALRVAARGRVVRVEPRPQESYGVAVAFINYRCIEG
jgi:hypothetical protein